MPVGLLARVTSLFPSQMEAVRPWDILPASTDSAGAWDEGGGQGVLVLLKGDVLP